MKQRIKKSTCIICDKENEAKSIEHIVSESFGNKYYTMQRGRICDLCNNKFSKFEKKALSNTIFVMERARLGIVTKKGKSVKGKIQELEIEGDREFQKNLITVKGMDNDNFKNYNPQTKIGSLTVKGFDKSEVATSKFLLMMGIESLFTSQRKTYNKYNFEHLKSYLKAESNKDWGFITADKEIGKFNSIPKYTDKYNLNKIPCHLRFQEKSKTEFLFKFKFGGIAMIINLLNRQINWAEEYIDREQHVSIYPEHINEKFHSALTKKKG